MVNSRPSRRVRIGVYSIMLVALLLSMLAMGRIATAAVKVSILEQQVSCTGISVAYSVTGSASGDIASIIAWNGSGTDLGFGSGPGAPGANTATVSIPVQPAGTPLYVTVNVGAATAESATTPCSGGGSGGPVLNPPSWSGYGDGRLNPNPAEYYSVWCKFNQVEVYRAVPQTKLLAKISIAAIIALGTGGSFNAGSGLTVTRASDSVTISGSNGNKAPASGAKSFSLSDCLGRNGGAPPSAPVLPGPPAVAAAAATTDPCAYVLVSQDCFDTHPCVWDPSGTVCEYSAPCNIDSNSWDCRGWQTAHCLGCWIVTAPPLLIPFILQLRSRRKAKRGRQLVEGGTPIDDANQDNLL